MKNQTNNNNEDRFNKANSIILNNDNFLVAVDNNYDSVAAGAGLTLLLESLGKKVDLYSPDSINSADYQQLTGTEKFISQLKGKDKKMEIVFNCPLDNIEKVSSGDEGEKLTLTVSFKPTAEDISPADIEIKKPGPVYSAGFILGVDLPNELSLTGQGQWIWMSRQGIEKKWADINVVEKKATLSESAVALISRGDFQLPEKAANNFYLGIKKGTQNFETADSIALETAAYCLRIKEKVSSSAPAGQPVSTAPVKEAIEAKESTAPEGNEAETVSEWKKPPIFTGATTPKK